MKEKSTPIGLIAGLGLIFGAIFMGQGWQTFFHLPSFILVVGGTFAALMVGHSFEELKQVPGGLKDFFAYDPPDLGGYVATFVDFSRTARREGLLSLDRKLKAIDDPFIQYGLEMAIDGIEEQEIDSLLRERIKQETSALRLLSKFFINAGTYAPAFGMVGTLIGLIQMLQNLSDPTQIGSGMSVALITTFYGALLANLVFLPMAGKTKSQATLVTMAREIVRIGVISIVRGESPSMIEKRLQVFIPDGAPAEANVHELSKAA